MDTLFVFLYAFLQHHFVTNVALRFVWVLESFRRFAFIIAIVSSVFLSSFICLSLL